MMIEENTISYSTILEYCTNCVTLISKMDVRSKMLYLAQKNKNNEKSNLLSIASGLLFLSTPSLHTHKTYFRVYLENIVLQKGMFVFFDR